MDEAERRGKPGGSNEEDGTSVDDDQMVIDTTRSTLERLGYAVHSETAGTDAVEVFSKDPWHFDVVITDKNMPDLSGFMVSERLLEMRPDIPIVLLTGATDEDKVKAEEIGIKGFVTKPVSRSELAKTMERALRKRRKAKA